MHSATQSCHKSTMHSSAQLSVSSFSLRVGLNCVIWYFRVFLFEGTRCKLSYSVTYYTYLSYICSVMLYISVFNFSFVLKWHFLWASNFGGIWPTVNHSQIFNTRYISTTGSGYGSRSGHGLKHLTQLHLCSIVYKHNAVSSILMSQLKTEWLTIHQWHHEN